MHPDTVYALIMVALWLLILAGIGLAHVWRSPSPRLPTQPMDAKERARWDLQYLLED